MTRTLQFTIGLLSGASLVALGAAGASAGHFKKISPKHTNYGVSQYNWTNVLCSTSHCVNIANPNHVDQIAAVLMYQRPTGDKTTVCISSTSCGTTIDFLPEVFLGCVVVELTAHGYLGLADSTTTSAALSAAIGGDPWPGCPGERRDNGNGVPRAAHVIWGPVEKVEVSNATGTRRLADGLGGHVVGSSDDVARGWGLLHPQTFALPDNDVVAGQKEAAIECVCAGLGDLFVSGDTFTPFGVICP